MNSFWDRLGISTSLICVIHCLLTPVLFIFLPLAGSTLVHGWFHFTIIAVAIPVAIWALWNGYRVHHQSSILWLAAGGFLAIALAVTLGSEHNYIEAGFMIVAGLLLASAHYINLRATHNCRN